MEHTTIAVDLAKSVFQVAVSHRPGHLDDERRLSRDRLLPFFAQRPPATIVLEACGSAHLLGPAAPTVRSHGTAAARARCATVRPSQQDRSHRRRRGCSKRIGTTRFTPSPSRAIEHQGHRLVASPAVHVARHADGAAEHPPWLAARIRRLHSGRGHARRPAGPGPTGRPGRPSRCCCTRRSRRPAMRLRCSRRTCVRSNDNSTRWLRDAPT